MDLPEVTDGAKVGTVDADDGQEGQVAFAGQSDLAAGIDADAVGIEEQANHHGGVEGWSATGLIFVVGVELAEVQAWHDFEEEEHEVAFREFAEGRMGL